MQNKPILKKPISRTTETTASSVPSIAPPSAPPVTTNPRDLDRSRAQKAWDDIQSVKTLVYQAKYGSLARKMPTLIQINGLAQTLAFLKAKAKGEAKGKEHYIQMFEHLSTWVCSHLNLGTDNLLAHILSTDSLRYRQATSEALAFLQWLKRFAEAELDSEEEQ